MDPPYDGTGRGGTPSCIVAVRDRRRSRAGLPGCLAEPGLMEHRGASPVFLSVERVPSDVMSKVDDMTDRTEADGAYGAGGPEPWPGYDAGLPAPPPSPPSRSYGPTTPPRRNGWAAALVVLVAAMLLAGTLIGLNLGSDRSPSSRTA